MSFVLRLDAFIVWVLLCLTVALFASIHYDPCNELIDGTETFLRCEMGVD